MAKYADKWKKIFPESIDNEIRPADGVDNTQAYNTDAMPQYMANDSVRFDLQNAINSQLVSNDERLKEKIDKTNVDLSAADKVLQSNIDSEASARKAADAAEANARKQAISDLQSALNTEVSNRQAANKALKSRLDGNEFVKSSQGSNIKVFTQLPRAHDLGSTYSDLGTLLSIGEYVTDGDIQYKYITLHGTKGTVNIFIDADTRNNK